jgi:hypothetical protein
MRRGLAGSPVGTAALGLWLLAGCGGGGHGADAGQDGQVQLCDLQEHVCPAGERCDRDRTCVPAEPLEITTAALPEGFVDLLYSFDLRAEGGLPPYRWELVRADPALDFLSVTSSGRLSGRSAAVVVAGELTVAVVDDGFGGGERVERALTLTIRSCQEGGVELCYAPVAGVCHAGTRTCRDGALGACVPGATPSQDRARCGPACQPCDAALADACVQGVCACGASGDLCQGEERCCAGACLDVTTSKAHCGSCFHDCAQAVSHLDGDTAFCADARCDYAGGCSHGYADCDPNRANGCEAPIGVLEACGACDVDCHAQVTHVPAAQKRCLDLGVGLGFACAYTGACSADFADCDSDRSNGCEAWLTQPQHCGDCGVDCRGQAGGELCLSPDPGDPYFHECGCRFNSTSYTAEGCPAASALCCARVCREGRSDPAHCGVCNAACPSGTCAEGACLCGGDGDCPASSGGTTCGPAGACVCPHLAAGQAACPAGQYCCDGNQGGAGGPDEGQGPGPDRGCCPKLCGQNNTDGGFACTQ